MRLPEHEKLAAVSDKSQACGEFIEWLQGQGLCLAEPHSHSEDCRYGGFKICNLRDQELIPAQRNMRRLLAEFFDIDEEKLEQEKQAILNQMRESK